MLLDLRSLAEDAGAEDFTVAHTGTAAAATIS
jgi:hypothetical protein